MHLYLITINTQPSNLLIWGHISSHQDTPFLHNMMFIRRRVMTLLMMIEKMKVTTNDHDTEHEIYGEAIDVVK